MGWSDEARRQFDLAQDLAVLQARRYLAEGFSCLIEDAMFPGEQRASYCRWRDKLDGVEHRLVILLPSLEKCLSRNRLRDGDKRLPDTLVKRFHDESQAWRERKGAIVLDNTDLTLDATVKMVESELRS